MTNKIESCRIALKKYRQTEKYTQYCQSEKGKSAHQKSNKKYGKTEKGKIVNRRKVKKYSQTKKGRKVSKRKHAKRRHNLGFTMLFENPFNESELIDWHHIDNTYVVAVPKDLHQLYMGKYHREKVKYVVRQIYDNFEN